MGFLRDRRGSACPKCGSGVLDVPGPKATYTCTRRVCRYAESVTVGEPGLFLERVALSKQMLVLYDMVYHNSPSSRDSAADAEMDEGSVRELQHNCRCIVSWFMVRANAILQIGGVDEDVEVDEVSFRSTPEKMDDGEIRVRWLRFIGAVRRGSSLNYWGELDDRVTKAGQGGGGKINHAEVRFNVLARTANDGRVSRPLFAPWSVVHSDSADAYDRLHRETGAEEFRHLNLWHTKVRHSKKKDKNTGAVLPVQYVVRKKIKLKSGEIAWRKGGTQTKDGFWSLVRRYVSRRSLNNTNRDHLRLLSYFFQWTYWRTAKPEQDALRGRRAPGDVVYDLLSALGKLRERLRTILGDAVLTAHREDWFMHCADQILSNLPQPHCRVRQKQPPR